MGKNYIVRLIFLILTLSFLWGCEKGLEEASSTGYGTMKLNLVASSELIELGDSAVKAATRTIEDIPDVNNFELYMYNSTGTLAGHWDSFSQFDPEQKISVAQYKLQAVYGDKDEEGYNRPYYEGSTDIQIRDREVSTAEIICKLANTKLTVNCSEAVKKYFSTFSMNVVSAKGTKIAISKETSLPVYLQPGTIILSAEFKKQNGTEGKVELLRVTDSKAQQHYVVGVDVNDGNVGGATLEVTYHTVKEEIVVPIDLSDASLNIKQPVFTTQGFENNQEITLREGAQPADMKVTLNARGGIRSCDLIIDSPYLKAEGFATTIDLASKEASSLVEKQKLVDKGLRLIGLGEDIKNLALIDFTKLVMNLVCTGDADETSSFVLRAVDTGGRVQETEISFKATMQSNMFAFPEIEKTVMIGSTEAVANVQLIAAEGSESGRQDVNNVIFEYKDGDIWRQAVTEWTGDYPDSKLHEVKIKNLPEVHSNLTLRARYGSKTSVERSLGYHIPDFNLTAEDKDIWARKATMKVTAATDAERDAVLKYMKLTHNGNEISVTKSGNEYTWENLVPGTRYEVSAVCNDEKTTSYPLITEAATQLPNSDFEGGWDAGPYDGQSINMGGPWCKTKGITGLNGEAVYETVLVNCKLPQGWATVNAKTMPVSASNVNTWYVMSSTDQVNSIVNNEGYSVRLRNVGWHNAGDKISLYGVEGYSGWGGSGVHYDSFSDVGFQKLNIPEKLYYSAGRLFLGSYSYDFSSGKDNYVEGYEFKSRPKQMKFKYKYTSKIAATIDAGYVRVILKSDDEVLFEKYLELGNTSNVLPVTIDFTYPADCKKASSICVMFCSSKNGKDMQQSTETISHYDIGVEEYKAQACVTGSELYIDDIELVY